MGRSGFIPHVQGTLPPWRSGYLVDLLCRTQRGVQKGHAWYPACHGDAVSFEDEWGFVDWEEATHGCSQRALVWVVVCSLTQSHTVRFVATKLAIALQLLYYRIG